MAGTTVIKQFNLNPGQRAERKKLITVLEWTEKTLDGTTEGTEQVRAFLGTRTPDSSIEYNPDIQTETDVRGNTYTDVNKTEPSQSFDPHVILGGDRLGAYLNDIRRRNAVSELGNFTAYIITAFIGDETNGFEAEKHENCSVTYDSFGGDTNVNFPYTLHFSNKITTGTVSDLSEDFTFTADVTV